MAASVLTFSVSAVILLDWVTSPVAVKSSVPVPTLEPLSLGPPPMLMAPVVRTNASALLVFTLRLVAAMSMLPFVSSEPIWPPLALSVTFVAVMVFTPLSFIEPALSVRLLPVRSTAPPMVNAPVLAVSPITISPVAPVAPEIAVISAAERSKPPEPAKYIG